MCDDFFLFSFFTTVAQDLILGAEVEVCLVLIPAVGIGIRTEVAPAPSLLRRTPRRGAATVPAPVLGKTLNQEAVLALEANPQPMTIIRTLTLVASLGATLR